LCGESLEGSLFYCLHSTEIMVIFW
jgi:hypothetical protein